MAAVAAYSFCDERGKAPLISVCFQPPVTPCGFPVPVSHLFPAGPPPHLSVDTGLSTGPSWLRCMSQVPRRGVKRAAEVNKSRAGRRPVTTCFTNRPVDSITGYAGHMVPLVTVKLIPCESYRQAGKLLGGAQEVLANCTHRFGHLNTSLQASGR